MGSGYGTNAYAEIIDKRELGVYNFGKFCVKTSASAAREEPDAVFGEIGERAGEGTARFSIQTSRKCEVMSHSPAGIESPARCQ